MVIRQLGNGEQPPCVKEKFRNHITGCYLACSNLLHAATEDNINLIEIARGRGTRAPTEHGHVHQENFKKWAIQQLSDSEQAGIQGHRLTLRELLDAFYALPEADQREITPHVPDHYFKTRRGFQLNRDILYKKGSLGGLPPVERAGFPSS